MKILLAILIQLSILLAYNLEYSYSLSETDNSPENEESTYISLKYPIYSLIVPGFGEYSLYLFLPNMIVTGSSITTVLGEIPRSRAAP